MSKVKFIQSPKNNEFGKWETADGFVCYTNSITTALRWYRNYLKRKKEALYNE